MATPNYPIYTTERYPISDLKSLNIGVLYTEWNPDIIDNLKSSCLDTLTAAGILPDNIITYSVPGSYELPVGAKMMLGSTHRLDAVICLGCVIQGETKHDDYINHTIARAISQISLVSGKPVIFGVLTTNNEEQAIARAGGDHGNKGQESAYAALKMISLNQALNNKGSKISF